ncbi:MAG: T9SS type A sorting domain-containing protein [Bacteroidetes bacterium]|nr:T9SS type A sorting domain-containing protein [Bacteroidota bacterium]
MLRSLLLSFTLLFVITTTRAQQNVFLTVTHKLGNAPFAFNQVAQNNLMQNFKITRMDYYISGITILHDGGQELLLSNKYILVHGNVNVVENLGTFNVTAVEGVRFSIGVGAPINNADPSLQPIGSPLYYQTPPMHWGWVSGYIFSALEGQAGTNYTANFQMHGLGNANYFEQTQMATGVSSGVNDIFINLDADCIQAVKNINVSSGLIHHGVNQTDLTVLQNMRDFVFSPSSPSTGLSNNVAEDLNVSIYPNPASEKLNINFNDNNTSADRLVIVDLLGNIVLENRLNIRNEINIADFAKGVYILQFYNRNSNLTNRRITIQ